MTTVGEVQATLESASAAVRELDLINDQIASLTREYDDALALHGRRWAELDGEAQDVARLESFSIRRVIADLRGARLVEREREQAEVRSAQLRVAEAQAHCEALERRRDALTARLEALGDVDDRFEEAEAAKQAWLEETASPVAERLAELAEERGRLAAERREFDEIVGAAGEAAEALEQVRSVTRAFAARPRNDADLDTWLLKAAAATRRADVELARLTREIGDIYGTQEPLPGEQRHWRLDNVWLYGRLVRLANSGRFVELRDDVDECLDALATYAQRAADGRAQLDASLQQLDTERSALLMQA